MKYCVSCDQCREDKERFCPMCGGELIEKAKPLIIYWETTKYHIALLISLLGFLLLYSMPWVKMDSLEAIIAALGIDAVQEATGIAFVFDIILVVPMILAVTAIVSAFRKKKVKALSIITGLVITLYWVALFIIYSAGKIGNAVGIKYEFAVSFYFILLFAVMIFIIGIILPEKKLNKSKGFIVLKKELDRNYYNLGVKFSNIVLLILLCAPFVKFNKVLLKTVGAADLVGQFLIAHVKTDWGISKFLSLLGILILFANIIFKIAPIVVTLVYLIKNRKSGGNLKLNKAATIYILITFSVLWLFFKPVDEVVILTIFLYIEVLISIGLIIASLLVSNAFESVAVKTKQVVEATAADILQKAFTTVDMFNEGSSKGKSN